METTAEWYPGELPQEGDQSYTVQGNTVDLFWKRFTGVRSFFGGKEKIYHPGSAIIFLPGWSSEKANSWSIEPFCSELAIYSDNTSVYAVDTKARPLDSLNIHQEAEAVARFAEDQGLKEVTLAGHSEGADQAIDVAVLLEQNFRVRVNGLILISSVGLYDQQPTELVKKFIQNALNTSSNAADERGLHREPLTDALVFAIQKMSASVGRPSPVLLPNGVASGIDLILGLLTSIGFDWKYFVSKFPQEVQAMAQANSNLKKVKAPIILIQGRLDPVSDYKKIIPQEKKDRIDKDRLNRAIRAREGRVILPKDATIEEKWPQDSDFKDELGDFVKKTFCSNSSAVKAVVAEGDHSLLLTRPEAVAKVGLSLLKRIKRNESRN